MKVRKKWRNGKGRHLLAVAEYDTLRCSSRPCCLLRAPESIGFLRWFVDGLPVFLRSDCLLVSTRCLERVRGLAALDRILRFLVWSGSLGPFPHLIGNCCCGALALVAYANGFKAVRSSVILLFVSALAFQARVHGEFTYR